MNIKRILATSLRVLLQLRHDPRTVALILVVPCGLIAILKYVFDGQPALFNNIAPMLLGIFPLVVMFLVTSIATLRERTSGTLDRLMAMPISKLDFVLGYALAFSFIGLLQASLVSLVTLGLLGVVIQGGTAAIIITATLSAFLGTSLGLLASAFATSEFQAVQFMPAVIMPQLLTCGLFVPRELMSRPLELFSNAMPLTYSVEATREVTFNPYWGSDLSINLLAVLAFAVVSLVLGAVTIRRQES